MSLFTVPNAGFYQAPDVTYLSTPTGRYELVDNPNKYWWEFWEPDLISRQVFKFETVWTGLRVVFLNKDQTLEIPEHLLNRVHRL